MAFSAIKHFFHYPTVYYVQGFGHGHVAEGLYRLTPFYHNPSWTWTIFDIFKRRVGYHGTSADMLGDQIANGQFDQRGKPVYIADKSTTIEYAYMNAKYDGTTPLVLRVSSDIKPELNDFINKDLGAYFYFPPDSEKRVTIEAAYHVEFLGFIDESPEFQQLLDPQPAAAVKLTPELQQVLDPQPAAVVKLTPDML